MTRSVLAAQLYTVRQFTQTLSGFAESIAKIRQIGYQAVQVSGIGPISNEDVARITQEEGVSICITHTAYDQLRHHMDEVIEQHKLWKCSHVAIGSMPGEFRDSEDGYRRFAEVASQIGEQLAQAGLTFSYHNHSFEFCKFGKRTGLEVLYEASDPRYLKAELDTYWVQHGGASPAEWVRRMRNRMPVVHLKDMAIVANGWSAQQVMAEIGEGNLDWPGILAACQEAGVQWYAVEQDECQRDPFESLAISYRNLRAMGLE